MPRTLSFVFKLQKEKNLNDLRACGEKQGVKASSIISSFKRAAGKEK